MLNFTNLFSQIKLLNTHVVVAISEVLVLIVSLRKHSHSTVDIVLVILI
jgi:hypothetical protein